MTLLDRAETLAFSRDTADALARAGFTLGFAVIAGTLAIGVFTRTSIAAQLLALTPTVFLPALLLLALSRSMPARHPVSVLLVWLLCGFMALLVNATAGAARGIEPQWLLRPLLWAAAAAEAVLAVALAWFAWHLYRKGAFDRRGGTA